MNEREQGERAGVKAALDRELGRLLFSGQEKVLGQTHPRGLQSRLHAIWNKELEIPLVPAAAIIAVLAGTLVLGRMRSDPIVDRTDSAVNRVLVVEGKNVYWQDDYERAVASIEAEDSR
ncbi:hypothetical protein GZH47_02800 [Paenibacillus rhizovicinus]|uniref:Uncharacterized protein n=1 Tax=Paenibacillus rhizovicinus TaxID=2704463 RepID=A0A6C0NVV5_9BACL|nr:hypothetical protein [Paenibacillus rhizovicinus]QHW29863.1 hypothetical protein GZH47_02800 [Paenibacillus rhizovicinus]